MPDLGVPGATLCAWLVQEGDEVEPGESLVEILAGAATFEIVSPTAGHLGQRLVLTAEPVLPGQTLAYIETESNENQTGHSDR